MAYNKYLYTCYVYIIYIVYIYIYIHDVNYVLYFYLLLSPGLYIYVVSLIKKKSSGFAFIHYDNLCYKMEGLAISVSPNTCLENSWALEAMHSF